jgi:hypothetical protein
MTGAAQVDVRPKRELNPDTQLATFVGRGEPINAIKPASKGRSGMTYAQREGFK